MAGSFHLNYTLKDGVGNPEDKINVNLQRGGKMVHLVMTGGIPSPEGGFEGDWLDGVHAILQEKLGSLDEIGSGTEGHIAAFTAVRDFCGEMLSRLESL